MSTPNFSTADLDARVDRFGRGVAARLSERTAAMPHDVTERLRFAREQALVRAAQARAAASAAAAAVATTGPSLVQVGSTLALGGVSGGAGGNDRGGRSGLWAKLVSALPLLALAGGLLLMQQSQIQEQLVAAAEVDTALLSDNLPPAAFSDPGFAEYLRDGEGQQ